MEHLTVFRTRDLKSDNWTPIGSVSPGVEAAHFWFGDTTGQGSKTEFYRIGIEFEQP